MRKSKKASVNRRAFLKSATVGAAALVAAPMATTAAETVMPRGSSALPQNATAPLPPSAAGGGAPADPVGSAEVLTIDHPGSDYMVDVIKALGFEYMCSNPGDSFRSFHESIINYGGNLHPQFITCCHEELAVGMSHGYAKIEGKPLLVCVHGTVGAQHAAMGIYDAYCDRVPLSWFLGISPTRRRAGTRRSGRTAPKTRRCSFATSPSGTTSRGLSRALESLPCALTKWR